MSLLRIGEGAKPARLLPGVLWRVLPFSVLVLLGIWLLASSEATRTLLDQLKKGLEAEANEFAQITGAKLTGSVDALSSLAGNEFIINALVDVEDRHSYLSTFFKSLRLPGTFDARVTLTDYRGRRIASNAPGRDYEDEPWIEKVMAGENVVELSRDVLLIAVPVWQFQQPDGAMVMELFSASFWSFLNLPTTSHVFEIWDRDNTRLHAAFNRRGLAESWDDNGDVTNWVIAEAVVPGFPDLRLTARQRESIAFAPAKRLDRFLLLALVLSVLAIIAGIAATAYFATRPLDLFIAEIDKVGELGGLGYRIAPFGSAEFHGLSRSLNQMLENLENTTTSRNFFNGVFNSITEILIVTDLGGSIHLVNWAATDATGWSVDELKQRNVFSIVQGLSDRLEKGPIAREDNVEAALTTAVGPCIPVQVSVSRLAGGPSALDRQVYVLIDITERKRAEAALAALAQYDILTGAANRSLFQERLNEAIAQAKRSQKMVALLLLDLDNFKDVNDSLGHPMGDALLVQVAERLNEVTRETDTVARVGGDEFAIVLTNLNSPDDAESVAVKLIEALEAPFVLDGHEARTGVSIGISVFPPEEPDGTIMFNHADFALYQAKLIDKSAFEFFDEEMNSERLARKAIEADLARAIESEQFELYYQPKLTSVTGEVTGVEALIRWPHPVRGMIPPAEFITVAESIGRIGDLSTWVLKEACAQHVAWRESGLPPIPIAVNLSAVQFRDGTLSRTIQGIAAEHGIDPAYLELEITESTIVDRIENVRRQLTELHRFGYRICIDDFGTGYSSLEYLCRFPINALKIDRTFVSKVTDNGDEATITKAIIALATSLDLGVIAEGVETPEQLTFLRQHGCPEIQGYFFSRPVPGEELASWLRARQGPAVSQQFRAALGNLPRTAKPNGRSGVDGRIADDPREGGLRGIALRPDRPAPGKARRQVTARDQ